MALSKKQLAYRRKMSSRSRTRYARGAHPVQRRRGRSTRGSNYSTGPAHQIFPPIKNIVFTFSDDQSLLPSAGSYSAYQYRANSLNDPDLSGIGRRPRYRDTFLGANNTAAPYQTYLVNACKAEAYLRSEAGVHMMVAMTLHDNANTAPVSLSEARERPDTVMRTLAPIGAGGSMQKITMFRTMKSIFGVKDTLDDDRLRANYNAQPGRQAYVTLTVFNPDASISARVAWNMKLTYYSKLMVKNDVADSL